MAKRTRVFPKDFSEPESLKDYQVEGLKKVLDGFRHLYQLLDDVLPTGDAKDAALVALASVKRASDDVVRHHQSRLTPKRLVELYTSTAVMGERVARLVVNVYTFADMKVSLLGHLDPVTSVEVLKTDIVAYVFGAAVHVSKNVPSGHVVVLSERDEVEIDKDWAPALSQLEKI